MEDNKQIQQINEATREIVTSLREGSQTIADSVLTIQDRNLRFTQGLFLNWIELLTHQMESVQLLQQQWGQQIQKRQGAFQRLMPASMQISMDLLRAPFFLLTPTG